MSENDMAPVTQVVHVSTPTSAYDIHVGAGNLAQLGEVCRESAGGRRVCVVSETNVAPLWAKAAEDSLAQAGYDVAETIVFAAGEASKNFVTLAQILEGLAERALTRDDVVVALGGGVTGDIAGLAAALYLRGIKVVQVPTSLLAMVDSSVGGKTAVDLAAGKNLAGAFWHPAAVVADVRCLSTISHDLLTDSCGEVIKHAVLADARLLDALTDRPLNAPGTTEQELVDVVARNVSIKRDVVNADEHERGLRQTLNLGHTIGHAIEAASNFELGHGSCVAAGLCCMLRAEVALGWCAPELLERVERCVAAHGLPTTTSVDHETLMRYMAHDKKRHADTMNIVIATDLEDVSVRTVTLEELAHIVDLGCISSEGSRRA